MARTPSRPISPHLLGEGLKLHWRWGPHMLVSILHRATGVAMAVLAGATLVWWVAALASGPVAYGIFVAHVIHAPEGDALAAATCILARIVAIGLTWAFLQHMASGIRHLVLDTGAGYELRTNKRWALATMAWSVIGTIVIWALIFAGAR